MVRTSAYQFFQNFTFPRREFLGKNITLYIGDKEFKGKVTKASSGRSFKCGVNTLLFKLNVVCGRDIFVIKVIQDPDGLSVLKDGQNVSVDKFSYKGIFYDNTEEIQDFYDTW